MNEKWTSHFYLSSILLLRCSDVILAVKKTILKQILDKFYKCDYVTKNGWCPYSRDLLNRQFCPYPSGYPNLILIGCLTDGYVNLDGFQNKGGIKCFPKI